LGRKVAVANKGERETVELRPEARLGAALRAARERRGISLRALARRLYRSHSNLVEYERGHRLAPFDVVQAYETELGLASGTLLALQERARLELSAESSSSHRTGIPRSVTDPALHQLPADVAAFTGREAELEQLRALVDRSAGEAPVVISAIAGMAGVGKTALAVHLAHELAPQFPDAQLYVNLHGYEPTQRLSPTQVLDQFLRALGMSPEALPTEAEEQAARYRGLLTGKRALVVLDNASSAEQVRPLLPGSPTCLVLVTSRSRLPGLVAREGARLLPLASLSPEEAIELLTRVVGRDRVGVEQEPAAEVVRVCGYLPLAVRIAGARLTTRPTMSLAGLAARLADEQRRLRELSAGDVQVRASFALSYEELDPAAARMFRRLGLIPGADFASSVAAALTGVMPEHAEGLLEYLVDGHLIEAAPTAGRYRFHDLLRLYARERLQVDETIHSRHDTLRRMLDWYLGAADAAQGILAPARRRLPYQRARDLPLPVFATHAQALAWFEAEQASLVAATHLAAERDLYPFAWQLPDALMNFFYLRKPWADWRDTHQVGLAAAQRARDRQAEAWMLAGLGTLHSDLRQLEQAIDDFHRSVAICREIGDRVGEARAESMLGDTYLKLRHFGKAIDCCHRALVISRESGECFREGMTLLFLGKAYRQLGQFEEAIDHLKLALRSPERAKTTNVRV
jgi:tetratricopeptide (TPR) repeat protein/transcriptional regulator with XRE-family HTH domain